MISMAEQRARLLSISEAAELLGVSQATVRRWVDSGKVPTIRLPSGHRRFEPTAIEQVRREMGYGAGGER